MLLSAQLALMTRQPDIWRSELTEVQSLLNTRFDKENLDTRAAIKLLDELLQAPLAIDVPSIYGTLNALASADRALPIPDSPADASDASEPANGSVAQTEGDGATEGQTKTENETNNEINNETEANAATGVATDTANETAAETGSDTAPKSTSQTAAPAAGAGGAANVSAADGVGEASGGGGGDQVNEGAGASGGNGVDGSAATGGQGS